MSKPADKAAPGKGGLMNVLLFAGVGLVAVAAGIFVPILFLHDSGADPQEAKPQAAKDGNVALVPFGEIVVNLATERQTRYLRVKLILVVGRADEKPVTDLLAKRKPFLKNWLICYLADRSLEDVRGTAGVNRARREILDQFNAMMFPDGSEKLQDVLFEEFYVS